MNSLEWVASLDGGGRDFTRWIRVYWYGTQKSLDELVSTDRR